MGEQIEDFNRLPKEEQPIAIARMREEWEFKPEQLLALGKAGLGAGDCERELELTHFHGRS